LSLWDLPLESLTFEQLDAFLNAKLPESVRLDYKVGMPDDLAKVIAAFANTLGGMIVLGVDEDGTTTEPVWPPEPTAGKGMENKRGLRDKVQQIARETIYPPVAVRVSPVISNKHLPGKDCVLLVVRVDESREAPHAIEKRKVYVYERDGSTSKPYGLAEIDHIARMLARRQSVEKDREEMLRVEIERAASFMPGSPLRWAAVVPYYPWRKLCTNSLCYDFHRHIFNHRVDSERLQQMPDGSYLRGWKGQGEERKCVSCSRLNRQGLIFDMEQALERDACRDISTNLLHRRPGDESWVDLGATVRLLKGVIDAAAKLYGDPNTEEPGYLMVSTGLLRARDVRLFFERLGECASRNAFLDDSYRVDHFTDFRSLRDKPYQAASTLLEDMVYAFDMQAIPGHHEFFRRAWR
jgi:hypothetical protein